MDQLASQALKNVDSEEDIEKQIEEALACPCVADLREGPCGSTFSHAFRCYIRSEHEEKGMDCLDDFKRFQECLKKHPDHVEKIMSDAEEQVASQQEQQQQQQAVAVTPFENTNTGPPP